MKSYNNEKGIISLTSWKARINTVYKTLDTLLDKCIGFHIVLVLSEEEFPKKESELPKSIMDLVNNNLIEILWIYPNAKSLKKVLYTMQKYKDIPIISADDDCLYKCNYAEELYQKWKNNQDCVIRYNLFNINPNWYCTQGPCTLYPPNSIKYFNMNTLKSDTHDYRLGDDSYLTRNLKKYHVKILYVYRGHKFCFKFHDEIKPLSCGHYRTMNDFKYCY